MTGIFQAQGVISKVTTMHDQTIRLTVDTQDLKGEEKAVLFNAYNKPGWFLFKEGEFAGSDIKDLPDVTIEPTDKTPSQRLRAVIYLLWERSDKKKTADEYYLDKMNKIIEAYKEKLD